MKKMTDAKTQTVAKAACGVGVLAVLSLTALRTDAVQATKRTAAETAALEAQFVLKETPAEKAARMAWWTHDRFGMFIHFGLYAAPARHEWIRLREKISDADYAKYLEVFNPDLFDAKEWAKAAKAAGMKYAVLTTKHHEGFCLWDTKYTDYKITKTAFGRDLVKEYVEAFRAEGLRVGFYYSLIDWHHPDFLIDDRHPLMPKGCTPGNVKGTVGGAETWRKINAGKDMARYRKYMKDQIAELLSNYGKIDVVWFDFSYPGDQGKDCHDWDSVGIVNLARTLQPGIIIDNRLDLNDTKGGWDFVSPEQFKVQAWPERDGRKVPWETCQTFSGSWGYYRDETTWKNPKQLVSLLADTVSFGGNLLLNVGPTARGVFDARAVARLKALGEWMRFNSRAIYGCTQAPEGLTPPNGTALTWNPRTKRLYLFLYDYPMGRLPVRFYERIRYAQFLHDGSEIKLQPPRKGDAQNGAAARAECGYLVLPIEPPDSVVPVVELLLKD